MHRIIRPLAALAATMAIGALTAAPAAAQATSTETTIWMCAVGGSGVTYRTTQAAGCRSTAHTLFSFNMQGPAGLNGTNGSDGAPGAPGAPGPKGDQGEKGNNGDKGDKGDNGNPHKCSGTDYQPGSPDWFTYCKGDKGDKGENGNPHKCDGEVNYKPGTPEWFEHCKGPKGDRGNNGIAGLKRKGPFQLPVQARRSVDYTLACDAGEIALSGGFFTNGGTGRMLKSQPDEVNVGAWKFTAANEHSSANMTLSVWAICASTAQ